MNSEELQKWFDDDSADVVIDGATITMDKTVVLSKKYDYLHTIRNSDFVWKGREGDSLFHNDFDDREKVHFDKCVFDMNGASSVEQMQSAWSRTWQQDTEIQYTTDFTV